MGSSRGSFGLVRSVIEAIFSYVRVGRFCCFVAKVVVDILRGRGFRLMVFFWVGRKAIVWAGGRGDGFLVGFESCSVRISSVGVSGFRVGVLWGFVFTVFFRFVLRFCR